MCWKDFFFLLCNTQTHTYIHTKQFFCNPSVSVTIKTSILLTRTERTRPLFIPPSNRLTCTHTSSCLQILLQLWSELRAEEADTTAERVGKEINLTKHVKAQTAGRRRSDREDLVGDNATFSMIMTGKTVRDGEGGWSGGALCKDNFV